MGRNRKRKSKTTETEVTDAAQLDTSTRLEPVVPRTYTPVSFKRCGQCAQIIDSSDPHFKYYWRGRDFCSDICIGRFQTKLGSKCFKCKKRVKWENLAKFYFGCEDRSLLFCTEACLEIHKGEQTLCGMCDEYLKEAKDKFKIEGIARTMYFCNDICIHAYKQLVVQPGPSVPKDFKPKPCSNGNCGQDLFCSEPCRKRAELQVKRYRDCSSCKV